MHFPLKEGLPAASDAHCMTITIEETFKISDKAKKEGRNRVEYLR